MPNFQDFFRFARPYRRRYGLLSGLIVAAELRQDYKLPPGTTYRVHLPDLRHPLALRAATSDAEVFRQLLVDRELNIPLEGSPRFIIDAGANIGLASVLLAARFPDALIVALEPDPDNYRQLVQNVRPYPRVVPQHRALWSGRGALSLANPLGKHSTVRVGADGPAGSDTVEAVGVPQLLEEFGADRIDLLKLDIEGAEAEVLGRGSEHWIGAVGTLLIELHDRFRPGCREALEEALRGREVRREKSGEYEVVRFGAAR